MLRSTDEYVLFARLKYGGCFLFQVKPRIEMPYVYLI